MEVGDKISMELPRPLTWWERLLWWRPSSERELVMTNCTIMDVVTGHHADNMPQMDIHTHWMDLPENPG